MSNPRSRAVAESAFERLRRREAEIEGAMKQEAARHDAVIKNMQRLKALRLAQDQRTPRTRTDDHSGERSPNRGGNL
jgi:hypothetical protein